MKWCRHLPGAFFALVTTAMLAGCASTGAPMPPTLELPKPPSDLAATRKGDKVYLSWTQPVQTTDRQSVRHLGATRVCRIAGTTMERCNALAGEVPGPAAGPARKAKNTQATQRMGYTDTLETSLQRQNPLGEMTYAVEVLNQSGRGAGPSNRVQVAAAPTLLPPENFAVKVRDSGVVLSWSGAEEKHDIPEISHRYRVYRSEQGHQSSTPIADLPLTAGEVSFEDHSFEWEKKYEYRLTVVTLVAQPNQSKIQVEGDDTAPMVVFVHDVYPPGVPAGLQAVASGIEQQPFVDLIWAPDAEADLGGYNVYRSEGGSQLAKINAELVKTPAYRDSRAARGKKYVYSVTAVDVRGNESAHSEEAEENVP
jgi:hypothetical protein